MKEDGTMIRPTFEVIENLLTPEKRVKDIDDHIIRLKMALLENINNRHCLNHIYHYLYDALLIKTYGID